DRLHGAGARPLSGSIARSALARGRALLSGSRHAAAHDALRAGLDARRLRRARGAGGERGTPGPERPGARPRAERSGRCAAGRDALVGERRWRLPALERPGLVLERRARRARAPPEPRGPARARRRALGVTALRLRPARV